jgi:hypothetical protein
MVRVTEYDVRVDFGDCTTIDEQCASVSYEGDINCSGTWTFKGEGSFYPENVGCKFIYQGSELRGSSCWMFSERLDVGTCLSFGENCLSNRLLPFVVTVDVAPLSRLACDREGNVDIAQLEDGSLLYFWGAGRSQSILTPKQ